MSSTSYNLEQFAQQVWTTTDIITKQQLLHEMVDAFRYKDKQQQFRTIIDSETRSRRLDKLAADLMLADKDKVISLR